MCVCVCNCRQTAVGVNYYNIFYRRRFLVSRVKVNIECVSIILSYCRVVILPPKLQLIININIVQCYQFEVHFIYTV